MIAILKYNAGNSTSLLHCLYRMGYTDHEITISNDHKVLRSADKVLFPGVGAAGSAMAYLKDHGLDQLILSLEQPFLGICLGMQLMCDYCEEDQTAGLGIFSCKVKKIRERVKVPHMGWNDLQKMQGPLFKKVPAKPDVYFVHSYAADICKNTIAEANYEQNFSAALQKNNYFGLQFHPEKSGKNGEIILKNFLDLNTQTS